MLKLVKTKVTKDEQEEIDRYVGYLSKKITIGLRQDFQTCVQKERPKTKKEIDFLFKKVLDRFRKQVPRS